MTRFSDLSEYTAIPAVNSLCLSPDGSWLAAVVQTEGSDSKKYRTSIWRVDTGQAPAVRLTRSADGEAGPAFLPDGSLLFVSKRAEPAASGANDADNSKPALWLLPAGGGEARRIAAPPGGVSSIATALSAQRYLAAVPAFEGTSGRDQDAARRKARADAGVERDLARGRPGQVLGS